MASLFSTIVVGVDGSEPSINAVTFGARLAREHDGRLILCNAANWIPVVAQLETAAPFDPNPLIEGMREQGDTLLREAREVAKAHGVLALPRATDGEPVEGILQIARDEGAHVVVMGTHGRRGLGRAVIGSTTEALLRASDIPVLTVRGKASDAARRCFERLFVAIDDSEPSDAAVGAVLALPAEDRAHVTFASVADADSATGLRGHFHDAMIRKVLRDRAQHIVDRALDSAGSMHVSAQGRVIEGTTDCEVLAAAREDNADLIVMGSHGRRGIQRFLLGSIAEKIVRSAPVPVLVVRSAAPESASVLQENEGLSHV